MKRFLPLCILVVFFIQSCYKETIIEVEAKFSTEFKNGDESIPVYLKLSNLTKGADAYHWEFEGGSPASSDKKEPGEILYSSAGIYTVKLTATNVDGEKDIYTQKIDIKDAIDIKFTKEIVDSEYPPVTVKFTNNTEGKNLSYNWSFEGGIPNNFEGKNPPEIIFANPGVHSVELKVSNGFETISKTDTVSVKENIVTDFQWETAFEDYDYQAPVKLFITNLTANAISYQWRFEGAEIKSSKEENPQLVYSKPGTYTIELKASNGKQTQVKKKQITIYPNTGIYVLENVKLGVNYAHNTNSIGAFYSTKLRRSFTANEITPEVESLIDIVFQGQNNSFKYNKFISPTQIQQYGFSLIPNAKSTLFVNSQEVCDCGLNFTELHFDEMVNDLPIKNLDIPNSVAAQQHFNKQLPRIVLFKTHDGRKGAIKLKQFVADEISKSYILCDIKVQK